jgi:hypothetical protein
VITATQLLAHVVGDYIIQSDWMAQRKTASFPVALLHAATYAIPFLLLTPSPLAMAVVIISHAVIDRWRLARFVVWAKNQAAPVAFRRRWADCTRTGYAAEKPDWMSVWLLIVADNTVHVVINAVALSFL